MVDALAKSGVPILGDPYQDALIPTHSAVLGSWVEAGVFGGVFWIIVLMLTIISVFRALKRADVPGTFAAAALFTFAWATLFSPFANSARLSAAGTLCLIVNLVSAKVKNVRRRKLSDITQFGES